MGKTSIEWTEETWNPTRGCSIISPGCKNCYALQMAARFSDEGYWGHGFAERTPRGPRWTGRLGLIDDKLTLPWSWREPRVVFVNSTSDLFHENVTNEQIAAVFGVMSVAWQHTFQILTKRAKRMREWFEWAAANGGEHMVLHAIGDHPGRHLSGVEERRNRMPDLPAALFGRWVWPLPNVWLGVSAESQEYADERIPELLQTPAAVRFVSYEPALGPVDFEPWLSAWCPEHRAPVSGGRGHRCGVCGGAERLDWIIVGGESGHGARPFDVAWARSTVRQCRDAGVACFVKQLGARPMAYAIGDLGRMSLQSAKGGDMAEWPDDLRVREFPKAAA